MDRIRKIYIIQSLRLFSGPIRVHPWPYFHVDSHGPGHQPISCPPGTDFGPAGAAFWYNGNAVFATAPQARKESRWLTGC